MVRSKGKIAIAVLMVLAAFFIKAELSPGAAGTVISYTSQVTDSSNNPIAGARIEMVGDPTIFTTSDSSGNFTLNGLPAGVTFQLMISKDGYVPVYSINERSTTNLSGTYTYMLHTTGQIAGWYTAAGIVQVAGKGTIKGRVGNNDLMPSRPSISGVVVTATSALHPATPYTVTYISDAGIPRTTGTYANGGYCVLNVDDGDAVTVTAQKAGWTFSTTTHAVHSDGVSERGLAGRRTLVGTWGEMNIQRHSSSQSWFAEAVRITFNSDGTGTRTGLQNDEQNIAGQRIKTISENLTYTMAANTDGSYTVEVVIGSVNNIVKGVFSDDGNMVIMDGTTDTSQVMLATLVRIDAGKAYGNADLTADYYMLGYERNVDNVVDPPNGNGNYMATSQIVNFTGAGTSTSTGMANSVYIDGHNGMHDDNATDSSYSVAADGTMTARGGAFQGYVSSDDKLMAVSGSYLSNNWVAYFFMKKDRTYSQADLAGKWAIVGFGDDNQTVGSQSFAANFGTIECDAAGQCNVKLKGARNGIIGYASMAVNIALAADGSFGASLVDGATMPKPPAYAGAIGNDGNAMLFNVSFDPTQPWHREVFIGVRANNVGDLAGAPLTVSGAINEISSLGGAGIDGVRVEVMVGGSPVDSTTTMNGGTYSLPVPSGVPFYLKMSKDSYITMYGAERTFTKNGTLSYTFQRATVWPTWKVTPGRGIIRARVNDLSGNPTGGATVTAYSQLHQSSSWYTICYQDGCPAGGPTSTDATTGRYIVQDVEPGDTVTITAQKTGWSFNQRKFHTWGDSYHSDSINWQGAILTVSGTITETSSNGGAGIDGVKVEVMVGGTSAGSATTANGGAYSLTVPSGLPVYLKMSKTDYVTMYGAELTFNSNTTRGYTLQRATAWPGWGVTPGYGIIRSSVRDDNSNNMSGVIVTAYSQLHQSSSWYTVCYQDGCPVGGPIATDGTTGRYIVKDVEPGDTVTITFQADGWTFGQRIFHIYPDSLHNDGINGSYAYNQVVKKSVNSRATYLVTSQDPNAVQAIPLSLAAMGIHPGDILTLVATGQVSYCPTANPPCPEISPNLAGLFSATPDVSGAIAVMNAPAIVTAPTVYNNLPTDIPQDFKIAQSQGTTVVVPAGAAYLFAILTDVYYGDNSVGSLAVEIRFNRADEMLLQDIFQTALSEYNKGASADINKIMLAWSANYLNNGQNFAARQADMQQGLNRVPFQPQPQPVSVPLTISGDTATMMVNWTNTNSETFLWAKEADGVWRIIGNQARHGVSVYSRHVWAGGYYVSGNVNEMAGITAVTISGPGITGNADLTHQSSGGWWLYYNQPLLGATPPTEPQTYTITVWEGATSYAYQRTVSGYVTEYAKISSPGGNFGSPLVFTWQGIAGASRYSIELYNGSGQIIWSQYGLPATQWSAVYNGTPLSSGTYGFTVFSNVKAGAAAGDTDNFSTSYIGFTYTGNAQPTITYSSGIMDKNGSPLSGVLVEQFGTPNASSVLSGADGNYTLGNILQNVPFYLKLTKNGYAPLYPSSKRGSSAIDDSSKIKTLFTAADLLALGVTPGKGLIRGHVRDANGNDLAGATVTVISSLGNTYAVKYCDISGSTCRVNGGTYGNGSANAYMVMDVADGDIVAVTAQRSGFTNFGTQIFRTFADSLHQAGVSSSTPMVTVSGTINETSGNGGAGIDGVMVEVMVGGTSAGNATTANGGAYSLTVPSGVPFYIKMSKANYVTMYGAELTFNSNGTRGYTFQRAAVWPGWGVTTGYGIIRSSVKDENSNNMSGVAVTATSQLHPSIPYEICYQDGCPVGGPTATDSATGRYIVRNVEPGDTVTITFQKPGWSFGQRVFHIWADSLHNDSIGAKAAYNVSASSNYLSDGYHAQINVSDKPGITSVTVAGPGISGSANLTYHPGQGWWLDWPLPSLGQALPTLPQSYTITVTDSVGQYAYQRTISGYLSQFVTITSPAWPSAAVSAPPTLSWSWPAGAPPVNWYSIYISDGNTNAMAMNVNNLPPTQTSIAYNGTALVSGHTYYYTISAGIGANSSLVSGSFTFDTSVPTGSVAVNGGITITNTNQIVLDLTASDPDTAGISLMRFSSDGATWSAPEAYGTTKTFTLPAGDGLKTISVKFADAAGNWSSAYTTTVTLDTSVPGISIGAPSVAVTRTGPVTYPVTYSGASSITLEPANVTLNATGATAGTVAVTGAGDARTVTISDITGDGSVGISIAAGTASDAAGNKAAAAGPSATVSVDNTAPVLTINPVTTPTYERMQTVTGTREANVTISVSCITATVGPVIYPASGTWSVTIAGMSEDSNTITVQATDRVGNTASQNTTIKVLQVMAGDMNNDGRSDLADAILGLQTMTGKATAGPIYQGSDLNGDGHVGLEEIIANLQAAAGLRTLPQVNNSVGSSGGIISLPGLASVTIPPQVLPDNTSVTLSQTIDKRMSATFADTFFMFNPKATNDYFVTLDIGNNPPANDTISATINVPDKIANIMAADDVITASVRFYYKNDDTGEDYFFFDTVDSTYSPTEKTLTLNLPAAAFNQAAPNDTFKAVISLAVVPTYQSTFPQSSIRPLDTVIPVKSPFAAPIQDYSYNGETRKGLMVTESFETWRENGSGHRLHPGIDLRAPEGTRVYAMDGGFVESAQTQRGYGQTIIIRHSDGSATLYAHLSWMDVSKGKQVAVGDFIGFTGYSCDVTGFSCPDMPQHLHVEYIVAGDALKVETPTTYFVPHRGNPVPHLVNKLAMKDKANNFIGADPIKIYQGDSPYKLTTVALDSNDNEIKIRRMWQTPMANLDANESIVPITAGNLSCASDEVINASITWLSSDAAIVSIPIKSEIDELVCPIPPALGAGFFSDKGTNIVTIRSMGKASIKATDSLSKQSVEVKIEAITIDHIKVTADKPTLNPGETALLTATAYADKDEKIPVPSVATDYNWSVTNGSGDVINGVFIASSVVGQVAVSATYKQTNNIRTTIVINVSVDVTGKWYWISYLGCPTPVTEECVKTYGNVRYSNTSFYNFLPDHTFDDECYDVYGQLLCSSTPDFVSQSHWAQYGNTVSKTYPNGFSYSLYITWSVQQNELIMCSQFNDVCLAR